VEDNTNARIAYTIALKRFGYDVFPVSDGQEAWDFFQEKPVDLVITDYKMPHLDGEQLVFNLHHLKPNVPVLMISAFETKEVKKKIRHAAQVYFLAKPFTTLQLKNTIDRILHEIQNIGD
jgi:two-component system response regulator AtoC